MPMFEGTFNIEEIYKGDVTVPEAYRGPEQVFPFAQAPAPVPGGDGTIYSEDDSEILHLKEGHTYKVMVADMTSGVTTYEVQELAVVDPAGVIFYDEIRLQTGKGSQKETYTMSYTLSGSVYGASYAGTLTYNETPAWAMPDDSIQSRGLVLGTTITPDFSASYSFTGDTAPTEDIEVGEHSASIAIDFTQPVRLYNESVGYSTGKDEWITRLPDAQAVVMHTGGGTPGFLSSLAPNAPEDIAPVNPSRVPDATSGVYIDGEQTEPSYSTSTVFNFLPYLTENRAEGASSYEIVSSYTYVLPPESQDSWDKYYKGKKAYAVGNGWTIFNRQFQPCLNGNGAIFSRYDLNNKFRKDDNTKVIGYIYMTVEEMHGKQYHNEPVWLVCNTMNGSEPNPSIVYLWGYEQMRANIGDSFTLQEYPPVAYIDYYTQVKDDGTVWHMITDCQYNPAGVVS